MILEGNRRGAGDGRCGARPCRFQKLKGTLHGSGRGVGWGIVHQLTALLNHFSALELHNFGLPSLGNLDHVYATLVVIREGLGGLN